MTQRGLRLRQRTAAHLTAMTQEREYVALRYRRIRAEALAPDNRMLATLNEVSQKVRRALAGRCSDERAGVVRSPDELLA